MSKSGLHKLQLGVYRRSMNKYRDVIVIVEILQVGSSQRLPRTRLAACRSASQVGMEQNKNKHRGQEGGGHERIIGLPLIGFFASLDYAVSAPSQSSPCQAAV